MVIGTFLISIATYLIVRFLSYFMIIYGKRRLVLSLLIGFLIGYFVKEKVEDALKALKYHDYQYETRGEAKTAALGLGLKRVHLMKNGYWMVGRNHEEYMEALGYTSAEEEAEEQPQPPAINVYIKAIGLY